jgi:hypothetical protein
MRAISTASLLAPLRLVVAAGRDRPGRWAWPILGVAIAVAFAGAIAAEAVIASDQAARSALDALTPLDRAVRITWQGPVTADASARARRLARSLGLQGQTEVTLLNPVRLSGVVVRPAAIAPLARWLPQGSADLLGPCRAQRCRMLLAGPGRAPSTLRAPGVRIDLAGHVSLHSAVPLGFSLQNEGPWPLILSGDPAGLDRLSALSSVYRAHSWVTEVDAAALHSWQIKAFERRLARAQATLLQSSTQFGMSAPFEGLNAARTQASAAARSLLLAAGGAIAALALFVALAALGLRREQAEELARLRAGGATSLQLATYVAGEALAICTVALLLGLVGAVAAAAVLASAASEPVGAVLTHSLITPTAGLVMTGGWIAGTGLVAAATQLTSPRVLDLAAVAAVAGLAAAIVLGTGDTGRSAALLAPGCCLAAGIVVFRIVMWLLAPAERTVKHRAPGLRLALIGLARTPGPPGMAIAFTCVAVSLGGFALAYRATLVRGAADQAADRVPLDATVAPASTFVSPLQLQSLVRWRALSHGQVFPVRRTQASYALGESTATVPALGVPEHALSLIHGWRGADASAPRRVLAQRLSPPGRIRTPGPLLTPETRRLTLNAASAQMAVTVTADLRGQLGNIRRLTLGTTGPSRETLSAVVPPGRWELEAFELTEGAGLAVTNGHQNGESATPATQSSAGLELGPALARGPHGQVLEQLRFRRWVGTGAASVAAAGPAPVATPAGRLRVRFQASGLPGVVRPRQPSDSVPVPVLADPDTAGAAGAGHRLQLTVDGQPVQARVVGVLTRFPTLAGASSFVVADEAVLAAALDAQLPGQGRADELWIASSDLRRLRTALNSGPLAQLHGSFRATVERELRDTPIARAMTGTLLAASAVSALLALIGLMLVVQGPFRDPRVEEDLVTQGLGPVGLRSDLRTRLIVTGALGIVPGVGVALLLDRLAVAAVGSQGTGRPTVPSLVTVLPALPLAGWATGAAALVVAIAWLAPRVLIRGARKRMARGPGPRPVGEDTLRQEWVR